MQQRSLTAALANCACCCALLAGCGAESLPAVSGTVTVDGQPLAAGTIQFLPDAGDVPSEAARIQDGKFSAKLHRTR